MIITKGLFIVKINCLRSTVSTKMHAQAHRSVCPTGGLTGVLFHFFMRAVTSVTNRKIADYRADVHSGNSSHSRDSNPGNRYPILTKNFRDICSSLQACAVVEHWNSSLSSPLSPVHSMLNNMSCWNSIIKHYLRAVQAGTASTLYTCILEVLGLDIGYPNLGFSWFFSVSPGKFPCSTSSRPRSLTYLWVYLAF